ncbi:hypothetical protein [Photobacterium sp. 1_MG-2023]|uniref:hypothetical protein n=1 Tax=Photobacterium sp. 1_MG-2023 TaxID=3062646 RepID=UPI0026E1F64C|nr:hypothetical protein [Photobacterium sp. 1_MG-2023]MDO6707221.1 hypothetical protein [Photobacterium sp. 1_MG-2023]
MNHKKTFLLFASITLALIAETAIAGPGGFWSSGSSGSLSFSYSSRDRGGDASLSVVINLFLYGALPFFVLSILCFRRDKKKRKKETDAVLSQLSAIDSKYEWEQLREYFKGFIDETYQDWQAMDTRALALKMTHGYFRSQERKYLSGWKSKGLTNICDVEKIHYILPYSAHLQPRREPLNAVTFTISVYASIKDYLVNHSTGEIIRGNQNTQNQSSYWTFKLENGVWKIAEIVYKSEDIKLIKIRKAGS